MMEKSFTQQADLLLELGLHFLWQGTAIALVAWLICQLIFRKPNQRSAIYLLALIAMPFVIVATHLTKESAILAPGAPSSVPVSEFRTFADSPRSSESGLISVEETNESSSITHWILGAYFVGLMVMMFRVVSGYCWSSLVRRRGVIVTEANWTQALGSAVETMQVRSSPVMIWSRNVSGPVITGIIRPTIILPVSLMSGLPMAQAVAVLSHELAHLRRFDHLVVILQRLLEAVFFFHPAVWLLSRSLDQEREKACDDLVLMNGNNPSDYAEALVMCAGDQRETLALAVASHSRIEERVIRILDHPARSTVRVNKAGWLTIAALILTVGIISLSPVRSEEKEENKIEEANKASLTILQKLEIKIPLLDFNDATDVEAITFIRNRSLELDPTSDSNLKGLNIVLKAHAGGDRPKIDRLFARNVTIKDALKAICMKTNMRFVVQQHAVVLMDQEESRAGDGEMLTRRWTTPEDFLEFITPKAAEGRGIPMTKLLQTIGIEFPEGASVGFIKEQKALIVRNTSKNLELVDALVDSAIDPKKKEEERIARDQAVAKNLREIEQITIPVLEFKNATLLEAVEFLRTRSLELDPSNQGVNINIFGGKIKISENKVESLHLTNVPLTVALNYVCSATKACYVLDGRNIAILPTEKEAK